MWTGFFMSCIKLVISCLSISILKISDRIMEFNIKMIKKIGSREI